MEPIIKNNFSPGQSDAAILFISGQSNSYGHDQFMSEDERITEKLPNVFILDRALNRKPDIGEVIWSGYTTSGNNIGTEQDHTYCLGYFTAKLWQDAIDRGIGLPDLYIIQIGVGAQGIMKGMWNKNSAQPFTVDILLYPFALKIFSLAMADLHRSFSNPRVIGWHWLGSEDDACFDFEDDDLNQVYDDFFDSMLAAIGDECRVWLYKIVSYHRGIAIPEYTPERIGRINAALKRQSKRHFGCEWVGIDRSGIWDRTRMDYGVFAGDYVHYKKQAHQWFAEHFLGRMFSHS